VPRTLSGTIPPARPRPIEPKPHAELASIGAALDVEDVYRDPLAATS